MSPDVVSLLAAAVLVVLAALLVAGETAFGRVSRARVEELQREGVRGADRLRGLLDDRARYVNVLLFLHMLLYVSAIVLVTRAFLDFVSGPVWWQLVAAALVMVVVGYVALGVAPRTLGVQHAERIAIRTAGPARALALLLGPLTQLLILVGNAITPGRGYREGPFASQAELRELVDLAEASDVIEDDERQMIHSVFELGDTVARELMVPRTDMVFVESTKTLRQAISLALRSGFSRIPVTGENLDDVVGVVDLKDMVRRTFEHHDAEQSERVASLMRPVFMVPDSKRADDLLREMQSARTHLAIVVDEYGGTAGIVTIEDVVEEIVGEITDEYDTEAPEVEALAHGSYRVHSRMHVEDFADLVGIHIKADEESVDTVGGLLAKRLGHVPISGARITVQGWDLTAESAAGRRNRIGTVLAEPVVPVDDEPAAKEEKTDADDATAELSAEDAKLVTLARGARGRIAAAEGAAVRDETGRTYSGATVSLASLQISALQLTVAQAAASGARGLEAAVVVRREAGLSGSDLAVVADLGGPGVTVHVVGVDGTVLETVATPETEKMAAAAPDGVHTRRAVLAVLGAAILFGTTGTAQALGPSGTTPLGVGAARIVVGGAGLLAVLPWVGGRRRDAVALWRTPWGLLAGVTTAVYQVCFFAAVERAGVALGTLVTIGSGPVIAGLLSWLLLKDRPRTSWVVATAVCVVGLGLLVGSGASQPDVDPWGLALALGSSTGYALCTVAAKRLMNSGHRSDEVMAAAFGLGGLILVPVLLSQPLAWLGSASGLAMALWLGLATTTVAYVLFGRGLQHLPAGPVTTLVLAEPVVATVLGVVVLGEHLAALGWVGAVLVLAGLALQGVASTRSSRAPARAAGPSGLAAAPDHDASGTVSGVGEAVAGGESPP